MKDIIENVSQFKFYDDLVYPNDDKLTLGFRCSSSFSNDEKVVSNENVIKFESALNSLGIEFVREDVNCGRWVDAHYKTKLSNEEWETIK